MRITAKSSNGPIAGNQLLKLSNYPPLLSYKLDKAISICYFAWAGSLICFELIRKYKGNSASNKILTSKYFSLLPLIFLMLLFVKQEVEMELCQTNDNMYQYMDSWSKVMSIDDVSVHHVTNMCHNEENTRKEFDFIHIAFHGFGSNCLSYTKMFNILNLINTNTEGKKHGYVAADVVGFGYNPRVARLNDFSKSLDVYKPLFTAKAAGMIANSYCPSTFGNKMIFTGHSMGYLPSILATINACSEEKSNSDKILVLSAPALLVTNTDSFSDEIDTTLMVNRLKEKIQQVSSHNKCVSKNIFFTRKLKILRLIIINLVTFPIRVLLKRILRTSSVWFKALSSAWGTDKSTLDATTIAQYKLPANCTNFLLDFYNWLVAQSDKDSFQPKNNTETMSYVNCLIALLKLGVHVIIMHGENDQIIPIENSYKLVRYINSKVAPIDSKLEFYALPGVGHVPHEECPTLFMEKVLNKLQ